MRLLLTLLVLLLPAVVRADAVSSSCQIIVESPECTVQFGRQSCRIVRDCGSGTCVANQDGRSYIATCRHVFANAEKAWSRSRITVINNGHAFVAKPFTRDQNLDLAVIVVEGLIEPVELDIEDDNDAGSDVESIGFPGGQRDVVRVQHRIVGVMGDGSLFTNQAVKSGTSGGGLFRRGRLRGVIWGSDDNPSNASSPDESTRRNPRITTAIRSKHVFNLLRMDGIRCRCAQRYRSVVVAPLPPQSAPVPPPPIDSPADAVSKIGPRGPKGDPGEIGPQGPAGKDADVSLVTALRERIETLEKQIKTLGAKGDPGPPGTVTVKLINEDGTVLKSVDNVKSGSVVRLRQREVEEKGNE